MDSSIHTLILGSGPAGYTAAIYTSRSGINTHLWTGLQAGGQLTITTDVENYPGFAEPILGPWLMEQMHSQTARFGVNISHRIATRVDLSSRPFLVEDDSGNSVLTESLIIATGATARWLGLENETRLRGHGVSACATCDGFFFKNQIVGVIGGGNTAAEEALFLTNHASEVILFHRRDKLRAENILANRVIKHPQVKVIWNTTIDDILGEKEVEAVITNNTINGEKSKVPLNGLFIAIGHDPSTQLFRGQLDMDSEGYIHKSADSSKTSIPGVFVAGDAADKIYRQAITAAGSGCIAGIDAFNFIESSKS